MRYENGQWKVIDPADRLKLCKTEGQVWLTLYQLLMDKDCQQKYEFNSHNKAVILKVCGHESSEGSFSTTDPKVKP